MSFTNYTAQALLNTMFGKTSAFGALATAPAIYVGLSTAAPTEGGSVTEPVANGYARVLVTAVDWGTATLADPSAIANTDIIQFAEASGAWGLVTHFFLADALTAGNVLAAGELITSKSPTTADTPRFAIGELTVTLD